MVEGCREAARQELLALLRSAALAEPGPFVVGGPTVPEAVTDCPLPGWGWWLTVLLAVLVALARGCCFGAGCVVTWRLRSSGDSGGGGRRRLDGYKLA